MTDPKALIAEARHHLVAMAGDKLDRRQAHECFGRLTNDFEALSEPADGWDPNVIYDPDGEPGDPVAATPPEQDDD
jgi:hypothetical protein